MASRAVTGRVIAVLAGLALAAAGAFVLWRYVAAADQRASEDARLVDVWVASGGIPAGTTAQAAFSQQLIVADQLPEVNRPPGAITNLDQIRDLAAVGQILEGTVLQVGQWDDPTMADVDLGVPEDRVALSLQVGIPQGLSGYLAQGDRVGLIAHIDAAPSTTATDIGPDGNPTEVAVESEVSETRAGFLVRDAEVLAVGRRVVVTDAQGNPADQVQQTDQVLATLAVTPQDAEKLVFASNEGQLYVTLLPPSGNLADTPGATFDDLFQE